MNEKYNKNKIKIGKVNKKKTKIGKYYYEKDELCNNLEQESIRK